MTPQKQEKLTRVSCGMPMGELLRRYWHPIAASCEVGAGITKAVRLLGEDLVLFRTLDGRLGLVDEFCPHRKTSLRYGHVDTEGLICPYHGWKFACDGRALSLPTEPPNPKLLSRARTKAYLAQELGGLIFAYLGPLPAPLLPRYDLFVWDGVLRDIGWALIPCNFLQIMENSVDPTHVEWLHGHHLAGVRKAEGKNPPKHYLRRHTRIGFDFFRYGITKRRVLEGGTPDDDDWRIGHPLIFPLMLRVGSGWQHRFQIRVPVDDTHTLHYWYACYKPSRGTTIPAQTEIPLYRVPWQTPDGRFITDFVDGGDIMAWVTQGPIADRSQELLVGSDRGLIILRRLYLEQIGRVSAGLDPLGVIRDAAENQIIEFSQETDKFRAGTAFVREAIEMSHVRYSPLKSQLLEWLDQS
ncbi:MAG: Rieske 2Fe-2S domain-containing protein [Gammaproteobacteria bacterium]